MKIYLTMIMICIIIIIVIEIRFIININGGSNMTLKDGKTGAQLRIEALADSPLKERLLTMGLLPGTVVTVLRAAPLGDPMAISVRSYNLALRRADAARIEVTTIH